MTRHDSGSLTARVAATLRDAFRERAHNPSAGHWAALGHVIRHMECMANGTAAAKVFLSSLDCGLGKTSATIHFARALVAADCYCDVGMLICVGRLTEAEALARALDIPTNRLAVLTSDDRLNALGSADPNTAQIMVTTQQRLEKATEGRSFAAATSFHYLGKPRQVRVWDEAWLPGTAVTLSKDELLWLPKLVRPFSPALVP